jgi:hypothetical protein
MGIYSFLWDFDGIYGGFMFFFNGILIVGFWWDFMEDLKGTYVIWWGY